MAASLQLPAPLVLLSRHSERADCLGCRLAAARLPGGSDINSKSCFSLEICEGPKRSWTGSVVPNSPRTGMGEPKQFINYRGEKACCAERILTSGPGCPYCSQWNSGDR